MVVAVSPGVGDIDAIVEANELGVVVRDTAALDDAAQRVLALAGEPAVRDRARVVARERYDVDTGAARYLSLYRQLVSSERAAGPS
jgi:glycosyltransferase involved in cell wall biosynthesis